MSHSPGNYVTHLFLPPYFATEFLKHRLIGCNSNSLKYLLTGGGPVSKQLMIGLKTVLPQTRVVIVYGQTESSGAILTFNPLIPEEYNLQLQKPGSSGKIRNGMQWKVVDVEDETKRLGLNQKGELRFKNDGYILNGYCKKDPSYGYDSEGYWETGDLVYYDEDECFYVVGRTKESFKYKGWHILPPVLEDILITHPAVKEAVIIGMPHDIDGYHPMAVVVLSKESTDTSAKEIETYYNEKVSENEKIRAGVMIVDDMPKSPTGKIQRMRLLEKCLNNLNI